MTTYETISIMIQFGMLIVAIISLIVVLYKQSH